jgi:hypothetical protein
LTLQSVKRLTQTSTSGKGNDILSKLSAVGLHLIKHI